MFLLFVSLHYDASLFTQTRHRSNHRCEERLHKRQDFLLIVYSALSMRVLSSVQFCLGEKKKGGSGGGIPLTQREQGFIYENGEIASAIQNGNLPGK